MEEERDFSSFRFKVIGSEITGTALDLTIGVYVPSGPEFLATEETNQRDGLDEVNEYNWTAAGVNQAKLNEECIKFVTAWLGSNKEGQFSFNPTSPNFGHWTYNGVEGDISLKTTVQIPLTTASNQRRLITSQNYNKFRTSLSRIQNENIW